MLQQNKPLKARTMLVAKAKLGKARAKPGKLRPMNVLINDADEWFSRYVRLRDSQHQDDGWYGKCITCNKTGLVAWIDDKQKIRFTRGWDNGHFISRGNMITRYEEENCNLQCSMRCNKMRSGEYVKYKIALREKYGDKVPEKLETMAENQPGRAYHHTRDELLEIIHDAKEACQFYESQH